METNEGGKAEKFFKEFGKRLDQFMVEAKDASTRMEADMKDKFEELKIAGEKIKKEAENKERWKEVEEGLKRAGAELENAFKSAFKKKE
jgi:hypothetical protein